MLRKGLIALLGCLILVSAVSAATKTLILKDGSRITGEVTETDEGYEVRSRFGVRKVARYNVERIIDVIDPKDEYAKRLGELKDDDAAGHLALGRWAMNKDLLEEAKAQFERVVKLRPDDEEPPLLLRRVVAMIKRKAEVEAKKDKPDDDPKKTDGGKGSAPEIDLTNLIAKDDIYRIRLAELRSDEKPRRVKFEDDVLKTFAALMEGRGDFDPAEFRRRSKYAKVQYILASPYGDAPEITGKIKLDSEVRFMDEFRKLIWPILRRGPATMQQYASAQGKNGLKLLLPPSTGPGEINERVFYTNFILLDSFETPSGLRMIDRDRPKDSLLLQYNLPPELSRYKNPLASEQPIKPLFTSKKDPAYQRVLGWIGETLRGPPHPVYDISFKVPSPAAGGAEQPPAVDEKPEDDSSEGDSSEGEGSEDEGSEAEAPEDAEPPAEEDGADS
ncbi:MAG: tetratricopeptide repeat protein [Planctomycetota bacterium]|jgi:hypothetical protein